MIVARFGGEDFLLLNRPDIRNSSRQTSFSNIVMDFEGKTSADLPIKYQEVKIVDKGVSPEKILSLGFVNDIVLPTFNSVDQPVFVELELLSPQTYLAKRTVEKQILNKSVKVGVEMILAEIVSKDGFVIVENTLQTTTRFSEVYVGMTVEKVMNELSRRFKFIYFVDELKNIHLKSIGSITTGTPVIDITAPQTPFLKSVKPKIQAVDYANKLTMTNFLLISSAVPSIHIFQEAATTGEMYRFIKPFSISTNVAGRLPNNSWIFRVVVRKADLSTVTYTLTSDGENVIYPANIGILGIADLDPTVEILLETSQDNPLTIIGFKYRGPNGSFDELFSASCLIPYSATYLDPIEINKNKGLLNTSGIVEKTMQMYGKYFTIEELSEYAKSLLSQNNRQSNIVELEFKGEIEDVDFIALKNKLKLTNKININLPMFFIEQGEFVIVDVSSKINQSLDTIKVELRTSNLNENYIDIFRKEDEQMDENDLTNKLLVLYNQDEKTVISQKILVDGVEIDV